MKKINNRYKRNFKNSLSFYLCLGFLTCITVWMYLLFSSAVFSENTYIQKMFEEKNVEDGQFKVMTPISEQDIENLQKDYDVSVEKQEYFNSEEKDYTIRIFAFTEKINKAEITEGSSPENPDEICLSQSFAEANNISIGSDITINNKKYMVTGYAERPDYLYMIENQSDSYHRASEFGLGFVTEDEMNELQENGDAYYSVVYNKNNQEEFRKYINEKYTTLFYMTAETNHRISTPKSTLIQFELITGAILPALLVLVIAVIAVVLGRKVKSEKKQIGTLTALGYRKTEIAFHYTWYALIPGIIGEIAGLAFTYLTIGPMANRIFFKLEKLPVDYIIDYKNVAAAMLVPVIAYVATAMVTLLKLLKMNVTDMLSGRSVSGREKHMLVRSDMNFKRKFKIRAIFNNFGRTMVALLGIVVSGLIMAVGLMMNDSCENYKENVIDDIGSFNYEYILNNFTDREESGEKLLSATFEVKGSENNVMLMGLDAKNKFVNLKEADGKKVEPDGKYYISSMASEIFNIEAGDTFTVVDTITLEKYEIKISGVIDNKAQSVIYSSADTVARLLGIDEGMYNVIMSDEKLEIEDSLINTTVEKQTMKDMIQNVISGMKVLIYLMVIFGAAICVVCIYLMVNMLIEENTIIISMLKVLGYHSGEINKITINVYHILVPIGIIASLAGGYYITLAYFNYSTATFQAQIPTYISPAGIFIFVAGIVIAYAVSLTILSHKVKNINMSDSIKSIRE